MTNSQKKALQAQQNNYSSAKSNTQASKNRYNSAYNNYQSAAKKGYTASSKVNNYQNARDRALAAANAMQDFKYDSKYTDKITGLLDKAENMDFNFNYSLTDDPAYQTYRDEYVHNGQLAAIDAAGNSVAQTGGFGSTAATAASQQAYNESLTQLNSIVPDLYNAAYNRQWNEFTNDRDTLQQLASAYQSLDQQGFEQALSTWENNFNKYITLADEYQRSFEYLDSAERQSYEAQLDAYYNLLSSAQNQYNTDQSLEQNALNSYTGTVNDIADYEETVRANKASEAQAAAELAEQKRQYNTTRSDNLKASNASSGGSGTSKKQTVNVSDALKQRIGMNRGSVGQLRVIREAYESGEINDAEREYLLKYFDLD